MHSAMRKMGLVVAVGLAACSGQVTTELPQLPGGEPAATLPASTDSTVATGVVEWKVYERDMGVDVYGVDQAGQVVVQTAMHAAGSEATKDQSIILEEVFPSRGALEIGVSGAVVRNTLSATTEREVLGRMATDFQAADNGSGNQRSIFSCIRASVLLVGACGITIATCLETVGAGCGFGGLVCLDAYWNWLCKCHHQRWAC